MSNWDEDEDADRILAQTAALLAQRGDEQAVALLIDVRRMEFVATDEVFSQEPDPWGYDTIVRYYLAAVFDVDDHLVSRFTDVVRDRILKTLAYVAGRNDVPNVKRVDVRPALPDVDTEWRETYAAGLSADRPTNQARRERGLANHPTQNGLTFGQRGRASGYRHYVACRNKQIPKSLSPSFRCLVPRLRPGHTWSPDFLVAGRGGRVFVIEVDGPHHRAILRRADDANRDLQWRRCGYRLSASLSRT